MPTLKPAQPAIPQVVPAGQLRLLNPEEIKPSSSNPRQLFDPPQLLELKKNIAEHGVLVPITVYQAKGQSKFSILDGERRYRCVVELKKEGHEGKDGRPLMLPANVVEPPSKIAGLLYMFSIHNFREDWELMPTALSLKIVMQELEEDDNEALSKLTGLSERQIERCKALLMFPERFQELSLDPDPTTRIPSNFWIEALPVLDLALTTVESVKKLRRDTATDKLVDKYRNRKIKSVIHFRRIMESYDLSEDEPAVRAKVVRRIEQFFLNPKLETREAFDEFVVEKKRVQNAISSSPVMLNILRDAAGLERRGCKFVDGRDSLRLNKIMNELGEGALIYVDDFIGTGNQFCEERDFAAKNFVVRTFSEFLLASSICEEAFYKLSERGIEAFAGHVHSKAERPLHANSTVFDPDEKERMRLICKGINAKFALGFRNLATMVVLYRNAPNTVPAVLRGSLNQTPFAGIFPRTTDLPIQKVS